MAAVRDKVSFRFGCSNGCFLEIAVKVSCANVGVFQSARMIRKRQFEMPDQSAFQQFAALAG